MWRNSILRKHNSVIFFHSTQRGCIMFILFPYSYSGTDSHYCTSLRLQVVGVLIWGKNPALSFTCVVRGEDNSFMGASCGFVVLILKPNHNICTFCFLVCFVLRYPRSHNMLNQNSLREFTSCGSRSFWVFRLRGWSHCHVQGKWRSSHFLLC